MYSGILFWFLFPFSLNPLSVSIFQDIKYSKIFFLHLFPCFYSLDVWPRGGEVHFRYKFVYQRRLTLISSIRGSIISKSSKVPKFLFLGVFDLIFNWISKDFEFFLLCSNLSILLKIPVTITNEQSLITTFSQTEWLNNITKTVKFWYSFWRVTWFLFLNVFRFSRSWKFFPDLFLLTPIFGAVKLWFQC